jgi:hypothetical protein
LGRRISWWQVPEHVRSAVEASLGGDVVEAVTQDGGYSPGVAAWVRLASGRRAFVKALGVDLHSSSLELYRNEALAMPHLPADLPAPRLLDVYDDGDWVALSYEDVEGRHPQIPWRPDELDRVAGAIADLGTALDPSPWPAAPIFADVNAGFIQAWRALAMSPSVDLDPSLRRMLGRLAADEVDLGRGGPRRGATPQRHPLRQHPLDARRTRDIAESSIDVVVVAGYAAYRLLAQRPVNPSMPDSHAYHIGCAEASLRWLRRRRQNE